MARAAVLLLAAMIMSLMLSAHGQSQPQRMLARFRDGEMNPTVSNGVTNLGGAFGENIKLSIQNRGTAELTDVQYSIYMNDECKMDGQEVNLTPQVPLTANIPVGGANISVKDIAAPDAELNKLPCGPLCLFANVSHAEYSWAAPSIGFVRDCASDERIDLALKVMNIDENERYAVTLGEPLDLLKSGIIVVERVDEGAIPIPKRSRNLPMTLQAFIRFEEVTVDKIKGYVDGCPDEEEAEAPQPSRRKRAADVEGEGPSDEELQEYYDAADQIEDDVSEWMESRDENKIDKEAIPECFNFGLLSGDVLLDNGEIMVNDEGLVKSSKSRVDIELTTVSVKLSSGRKNFCALAQGDQAEKEATIFLVVDPLRMNDDPKLCDNHFAIKVKFTCNQEPTEYDQGRCEIVVDPLSRGHKAEVFYNDESVLRIDGETTEFDEEVEKDCKSFNYYTRTTEYNRWQVLTNRYQAQAAENPELCKETAMEEASREAAIAAPDEEDVSQEKRRKRRNTAEDDAEMIGKLRNALEEIANTPDAVDEDTAKQLLCMKDILTLEYELLENAEELQKQFDMAEEEWEALAEKFELYHDFECPDNFEVGGESFTGLKDVFKNKATAIADEVGGAAGERIKKVVENAANEDKEWEDAMGGDMASKLAYLKAGLEADTPKCPRTRGQSSSGKRSKSEQFADMVGTAYEFKTGEVVKGVLPNSTCGRRKLQQVLDKGLAKYINRDMTWAAKVFSETDKDFYRFKYLTHLNDELEAAETDDVSAVKDKVKQLLDADVENDLDACGADREVIKRNAIASRYTVDDTYDKYWMMKDGKVYMGIADALNASFGLGNDERQILWKPVATCYCSKCNYMVDPYMDYSGKRKPDGDGDGYEKRAPDDDDSAEKTDGDGSDGGGVRPDSGEGEPKAPDSGGEPKGPDSGEGEPKAPDSGEPKAPDSGEPKAPDGGKGEPKAPDSGEGEPKEPDSGGEPKAPDSGGEPKAPDSGEPKAPDSGEPKAPDAGPK